MGGGDNPSVPTNETMDSMMKSLVANFPQLSKVSNEAILPAEQAQLAAAQQIQPQYTQSQLDLWKQFGPQLTDISNQLAAQSQAGAVTAEGELLKGAGGDLIRTQEALQRQIDPEYYAAREQAGKLIGSYDPEGRMSGGQLSEVERGLNRMNQNSGISGLGTSTETLRAAGEFGNQVNANKNALAQALATVGTSLGGLKSGTNVQSSLAPSTSASGGANNLAQSQFLGFNSPNIGATSNSLVSQALGSANSMAQNVNATNSSIYGSQMGNKGAFNFGFGPISFGQKN